MPLGSRIEQPGWKPRSCGSARRLLPKSDGSELAATCSAHQRYPSEEHEGPSRGCARMHVPWKPIMCWGLVSPSHGRLWSPLTPSSCPPPQHCIVAGASAATVPLQQVCP